MTGKIRVSIVATALDGHKTENKTVLNMFSRVNNRNTGYSENLFSQNSRVENNTFGSIDGANALKLDESYQVEEEDLNTPVDSFESQPDKQVYNQTLIKSEQANDNLPTGLSIESAAYMENNNLVDKVDTFHHWKNA